MLNKFIILTTQRTGSTFLRLWLNNHPDIRCHGEIFLRHYNAKDGYKMFSEQTTAGKFCYHLLGNKLLSRIPENLYIKHNMKKYFSALYYDPKHSGPWTDVTTWNEFQPNDSQCKCVGFKIMKSTIIDYPILKEFLTKDVYKVIVLRRDNVLDTYLSRLSLRNTGVAHSQNKLSHEKLFVDPQKILPALKNIEKENGSLAMILPNNDQFLLSYEEMFNEPSLTIEKLQQFLCVPSCTFKHPKLKKVNPTAISNRIKNYTDIADALHSTKFEKYFH